MIRRLERILDTTECGILVPDAHWAPTDRTSGAQPPPTGDLSRHCRFLPTRIGALRGSRGRAAAGRKAVRCRTIAGSSDLSMLADEQPAMNTSLGASCESNQGKSRSASTRRHTASHAMKRRLTGMSVWLSQERRWHVRSASPATTRALKRSQVSSSPAELEERRLRGGVHWCRVLDSVFPRA